VAPVRTLAFLVIALPALAAAHGPEGTAVDRERPLETPSGIVDGEAARALVDAGAVVVDVRTPEEFAAGHVPGAKNIPHGEIRARASEIGGPETPVLLYCQTGRRSAIAGAALRELGYEKLWDLQSFARWSAEAQ
jgi:rhodanese-related sulfurtransferase